MSNYMSTTSNTTPSALQLRHATLQDIVESLERGVFTTKQLVRAYITRISEVNHEYRAVIETNPDATEDARLLDLERCLRGSRGKLHGIPILLKDNISTIDNTDTTCGSMALIGAKSAREATIVTALRSSGAIVLGKANMAEWSGFRSTSGCSGWSARGGQTTGVFYPNTKASGSSSSGSAVAVALGLCFAALGTETCYSIVSPAEKSGIIGFKPTRSLISSDGIIHASQRLDTVGLLTRNVYDAAEILLELVYHSNHHELSTKLEVMKDIAPSCTNLDLTNMHIGIPWRLKDLETLHLDKRESFRCVLATLKQAGATLIHDVQITGAEEYEVLPASHKQILLDTDMKHAIDSYLSSLTTNPQNIHDIGELIAFTKACPEEDFPQRNVAGFERAQATSSNERLYCDMMVRDTYFTGPGGIEAALDRHRCDILLIPTLSVTMQTFAAKAGSPVMSVPMGSYARGTVVEEDTKNGLVDIAPGIPFSVYIFGRATKDGDVLKVGHVLEHSLRIRETLQPYLEARTEVADIQVGWR